MNQRIQELAKQAWIYQMRVYEDNGVRTYGEREQVFSKEKFAELIVRECADIANKQFTAVTGVDDRDCLTAAEMKQHFGVEDV